MDFRFLRFPALLILTAGQAVFAADLRVGMIGLDTSHVVEFTKRLNDSADKNYIPGARVVAALKGGSPDIAESWNRVPGYTKTLREKYDVKIVDDIGQLLKEVDVVMIESLDGRPHLAEATPVINAGKPIFVDKPVLRRAAAMSWKFTGWPGSIKSQNFQRFFLALLSEFAGDGEQRIMGN